MMGEDSNEDEALAAQQYSKFFKKPDANEKAGSEGDNEEA